MQSFNLFLLKILFRIELNRCTFDTNFFSNFCFLRLVLTLECCTCKLLTINEQEWHYVYPLANWPTYCTKCIKKASKHQFYVCHLEIRAFAVVVGSVGDKLLSPLHTKICTINGVVVSGRGEWWWCTKADIILS